jgi:hypothetical protein
MEIFIGLTGIALTLALLAFVGRFGFLIARRAGFPGWTGAIIAVPVVGVVALWVLGFRRWPDRAGLFQRGS